jgi:hypothetical protein
MNISEIKKLNNQTISDIDPMFVQDISETETKMLVSLDLSRYVLSSSNLVNSLKTGSFTGSFDGTLFGTSVSASNSVYSKYSITSNYLNYPNNSSASFAISSLSSSYTIQSDNSISSSYSLSSTNSTTSSYAHTCIVNTSISSSIVNLSNYSVYSSASNYLVYNGTDNGRVYKSIISEYSPTSSTAVSLVANKQIFGQSYWGSDIFVNASTASYAYSSSISDRSTTSRYIKNVNQSENSSFAMNTDMIPFAYVNFTINHENGENWEFIVNQYKNVAEPGIGLAALNKRVAIFTGSYYQPPILPNNSYISNIVPSATILAETSFNFPFDVFVNYWFNTFTFPIGNDKFAIGVRIGIAAEESQDNILLPLLKGSSISAIMFSNVLGKQYPESIVTSSVINGALTAGCAKI